MLVAEAGGAHVGYLLAHTGEAQPIFELRRHGVITDVYVVPEERRKGLGRRLVEQAVRFFGEREVKDCRANVLAANGAAKAFWTALGFGEFACSVSKRL